MKLKQISIFLENSPGRLYDTTNALATAGLNLRSLCIADTSAFGVLRILISDVNLARHIVMEKHLPARVEEVLAIELDDIPGSLAQVLKLLMAAKINVDYMYALAGGGNGKAVMIFHFNDNDRALEILQHAGIRLLDAASLGMLENQQT